MREGFARNPDLGRLRVALMEIGQRLVVRAYLHASVHPAGDDARAFVAGDIDAVDVVAAALFDHGVNAFGVWAPVVRADRERAARGRIPRCGPPCRPIGNHQTDPISLESRALHGEVAGPVAIW